MPVKVTMAPRRSVALFALLAIAMVIASYVIVIILAVACIYLPYWIIENAEHAPGQILLLLLGGVVIAGAMLWSLIPRRDRFEPPGPLLERTSHPRLFAELDNIAASLNEPLPLEVYLIGQVNAFVADRGGILGFGSRRIMAIGLPLLSILTISEFRGVLAHEFAHYYSGDTKLGPFVYKTQSAMIRTFQNIGSIQELNRIAVISLLYSGVAFVLKHYFILFLRVTNFISRKKEYRADELACFVAGVEPLIQGLRRIHGAAMAWPTYWNTEVVPVLNQSCMSAFADGFARFLVVPEIALQVAEVIGKEMEEGKIDPYDTHPPLRDRIAAIEQLTVIANDQNSALALSLLDSPEDAELQFIAFVNPNFEKEPLRRVGWDEIGPAVTIPYWKSTVTEHASLLEGITADAVPDFTQKLSDIGSRMRDPKGTLLTREQRTRRAGQLVASALGLALLDKEWQLETRPGQFFFYRGDEKINMFALVDDLLAGKIAKEAWASICTNAGISGTPLVPADALPAVRRS
jgi:Zn-dependent protease with chaperone function